LSIRPAYSEVALGNITIDHVLESFAGYGVRKNYLTWPAVLSMALSLRLAGSWGLRISIFIPSTS
jgi:hypothetical protein